MEQDLSLSPRKILWLWCLLFAATLAASAVAMLWLDQPLARLFAANIRRLNVLGHGLSSSILIAGEMVLMVGLAAVRIARGSLPKPGNALLLACCASLCAYAVNDCVLKIVFGRPSPDQYLFTSLPPVFHFLQGGQQSSFPSGHMVMASAFAIALARIYPRTLPAFMALLCLGAGLLVVGDWHFLSDAMAGFFVGGTAGFVAGELWIEHAPHYGKIE
ncbi:MAG TPA: phosphatase PAP2 family protein [Rhizomicrobium sp.]